MQAAPTEGSVLPLLTPSLKRNMPGETVKTGGGPTSGDMLVVDA